MSWLKGRDNEHAFQDAAFYVTNDLCESIFTREVIEDPALYNMFDNMRSRFTGGYTWPDDKDMLMHYLPDQVRWW